MKREEKKAYIDLHIATIFFGLTAILGAKISLVAVVLVWWRVLLTGVSLSFLVKIRKIREVFSLKEVTQFCFIGFIVAIHWVTFYHSIKLSNPSITLVCFATTTLFTSFIEPFVLRTKFQYLDLFLSLIIIPLFAFILLNVNVKFHYGAWIGVLSAFLASVFAVMNKKYIKNHDPKTVTFLEMWSACLFITFYLPFYLRENPDLTFLPSGYMDWFYLIVLALFCTTYAFYLSLRALKYVSAFTSNLIISLEPVYGIIMAAVLLKDYEMLNFRFYIGCVIILGIVLTYPILKKNLNRRLEV